MRAARLGVVGALLSGAVLVSSSAQASGLSVARFGGEHGNPMTDNATALYYNPAGIGFSEGTHLMVDLAVAWRHATYEHTSANPDAGGTEVAEPADAQGANNGKGKLFNVLMSPGLGLTFRFGSFAAGAGFFTPFGGQARWGKNEDFRGSQYWGPVDGTQRWYAIDGELRSSFVPIGLAWRVTDDFSIGLTGNLIITKVATLRARNASGDNNIATEGRSLIDVSGLDYSMGAGVMFAPKKSGLRLGLSYQSRPHFGGDLRAKGTLSNNLTGRVDENHVDFITQLPDVFRLGGSLRTGQVEFRLFGDYTRWSVMQRQCVVDEGTDCDLVDEAKREPAANVIQAQIREWKDTWGLRGGVSYFSSDKLELMGGVGYGSNAVPNRNLEPALMDFDSFTVTAGLRLGLGDHAHLAPSYTQVIYLSRDTTGESEHGTYKGHSTNPDSSGKYAQQIGVVGVNFDWKF